MLNHSLVPVGSTGYSIDNSLRFNDNDSAYLNRTPSSAGNRKTWTWSGWVKRGNITTGLEHMIMVARPTSTPYAQIYISTDDKFWFEDGNMGVNLKSNLQLRDTSAWYHLLIAIDTTQPTASNRAKVYLNGEQVTNWDNETYPTQNTDGNINNNVLHDIGRLTFNTSQYLDGYLAEVNFVDGQALTPSDFGETDETYGHWKPKKYTGTYGTNGFYLDFKDSGSLGNDVSGAGNNWTPNNLSATDQMLDSPTNNFCTLNPTYKSNGYTVYGTLAEGNLKKTGGENGWVVSTQSMSTGKWYWETLITNNPGNIYIGAISSEDGTYSNFPRWRHTGATAEHSSNITLSTFTGNDILQFCYDADNNRIYYGKNGTWENSAVPSSNTGYLSPLNVDAKYAVGQSQAAQLLTYNFGQDSSFAGNKTAQGNADDNGIGDFYYTPPTGFLALCTQNLPEPTVVPSEHFNTVAFTSGASSTDVNVGFQPDFVWHKKRNAAENHYLIDQVRGGNKVLWSNLTNAEATATAITAWNTDGYTVDANLLSPSSSYVSWNWKANGTGVSNTDGSITSTVSANVDAGFSIVSYTGSGADSTVGHGLSSAPEIVIAKSRGLAGGWRTWNKDIGDAFVLSLDSTAAAWNPGENPFNDTAPTSTVFSVGGSSNDINRSGIANLAYCFHSVDGYSKVGSYTGNGSTDGTFVHCGFRPAYVMFKGTDTTYSWDTFDNKRDPINDVDGYLAANDTSAENHNAVYSKDFLSNGFKLRTTHPTENGSGNTYIYIAFAEHPFKHSNAR